MTDESGASPIRVDGLEINVVDDGFVVYQASHDRVHYLNHTAGILLELCNGAHDAPALAGLLRRAYSLQSDPAEEVTTCLASLRKQELIR